ncbi:MAG: STAS domain-containing protein [Defluviicoccus sp.]|nr:STAS domain-containing protein [Defluviicoccus sp.]
MDLTTERSENVVCVDVKGRIDGSTAVAFEEAVRNAFEESDRAMIMDFRELAYISSAGLRVILLTAKSLQSQDAKLVLCSLSEQIREVFKISGFDKLLPIHEDREEARASLGA